MRLVACRWCQSLAPLLVVVALAAGCSSSPRVTVRTERGPIGAAPGFQTYSWGAARFGDSIEAPRSERELFDWRLRTAVDAEMGRKGYTRIAPGQGAAPADLVLSYKVRVENRTTDSFREYFDYVQAGGDRGLGEANVQGYDEGELVFEIFDTAARDLVWRATAQAIVRPGDSGQNVGAVVPQLLAGFPSRAP